MKNPLIDANLEEHNDAKKNRSVEVKEIAFIALAMITEVVQRGHHSDANLF